MGLLDHSLALRADTTPHHISGIACEAKACVYHDGDSYCTAKKVNIGSITASNAEQTRCATFVARGKLTKN